MQITADYIDSMLVKAEKVGNDQRKLEDISRQFAELVSRGTFKMRKIYEEPLSDEVLRPLGEANHVIVKVRMKKDAYRNVLSYEYTFIYKWDESIERVC